MLHGRSIPHEVHMATVRQYGLQAVIVVRPGVAVMKDCILLSFSVPCVRACLQGQRGTLLGPASNCGAMQAAQGSRCVSEICMRVQCTLLQLLGGFCICQGHTCTMHAEKRACMLTRLPVLGCDELTVQGRASKPEWWLV